MSLPNSWAIFMSLSPPKEFSGHLLSQKQDWSTCTSRLPGRKNRRCALGGLRGVVVARVELVLLPVWVLSGSWVYYHHVLPNIIQDDVHFFITCLNFSGLTHLLIIQIEPPRLLGAPIYCPPLQVFMDADPSLHPSCKWTWSMLIEPWWWMILLTAPRAFNQSSCLFDEGGEPFSSLRWVWHQYWWEYEWVDGWRIPKLLSFRRSAQEAEDMGRSDRSINY